jgi:hypothetical protein
MKRFPLLIVVAMLVATVSMPAQSRKSGNAGRHQRSPVAVASPQHHHNGRREHRPAPRPQLRQRVRWETRYRRVHVPGYWDERCGPPTYGWVYDSCGHRSWGVIAAGVCHRVWVPPRWDNRPYRCEVRY